MSNLRDVRSQVCMAGGALTALCYACCPFLSDATAWRIDGGGSTMAPCCAFRPFLHMYAQYIYIYTHVFICACAQLLYLFICIHLCICMNLHIYIYIHICMYIYVCVCYVIVYVLIYVYLFSKTAKRKTHPDSTEDSIPDSTLHVSKFVHFSASFPSVSFKNTLCSQFVFSCFVSESSDLCDMCIYI